MNESISNSLSEDEDDEFFDNPKRKDDENEQRMNDEKNKVIQEKLCQVAG